jgi:two-component system, NtrC family, response regulator HydG
VKPRLGVFQVTEAFSDYVPELAASVGLEFWPICDIEDIPPENHLCGVLVMAGGSEIDLPKHVSKILERCSREVVAVGANGNHRLAIDIIRSGAANYFAIPTDTALLRDWACKIAEECEDAKERAGHKSRVAQHFDFSNIIGESKGIRAAIDRAARIIPQSSTTVLITGETGTGKDLFAQAIHHNSPRHDRPFVEINCSALPLTLLESELFGYERGAFTDARTAKAGLFEVAHGGTLFLDEVADLPLELQPKLLKVLESGRVRRLGGLKEQAVDFRIIAATHVDLRTAVSERRFRQDLFFRLDAMRVHLPPLRERGHDVILLAERFLHDFCTRNGLKCPDLGKSAQNALRENMWPGNIRELKNAVERAVLLGDGGLCVEELRGGTDMLFSSVHPLPFPAKMDRILAKAADEMLKLVGGNKSRAAQELGISRKYLYVLLEASKEKVSR